MSLSETLPSGSVYFSMAAVVFMLLFLMLAFFNNTSNSNTRTLMVKTAIMALIGCLAELMATVAGKVNGVSNLLKTLLYTLNMATMFLSAIWFNKYTYAYIGNGEGKHNIKFREINSALISLFYVLLFGNLFFNYAFVYTDEGLLYGPMTIVLGYLAPLFYLLADLVAIFWKKSNLTRREFVALIATHICVITGAVLQGILEDRILLVSFFITIGLYIIYSFLEAPDYQRLLETNKKLMDAEKRANEANRAKSNFLSSMSHEIRTPMNAVIGMNELTRMVLTDEKIKADVKIEKALGYAESIKNAGESLLYVINDILDVTKIESGKMDIVPAPYHMKLLLDDICESFSYQAANKGLLFLNHIDGDLPGYVSGDKLRVRQIITNIVNNGLKYTKEGSVSLDVSGKLLGDKVIYSIAVSDTGIGIKEENLDHLFDTFGRVDDEDTHFIEGTGLGLSIVKNLLDLMDGEISVESIYGKGSVFTVHLPQQIVSNEKISDYKKDESDRKDTTIKYLIKGRRILVVDDNLTNIAVAKSFLQQTEAEIRTARSGAEALPLIENVKYDLIFMDHMMPGMSGDKVVSEIRRNPKQYSENSNTPIVAMTANATAGLKQKYIEEYGFDDYLAKPFKFAELINVVKKYIKDGIGEEEEERGSQNKNLNEGQKEESVGRKKETLPVPDNGDEKAIDHIDVEAALSICESEDIYKSIIEVYLETKDENIQGLKDSLAAEDWLTFQTLAHAIKSSSASLGANNFSDLSKDMEHLAGERSENEDIDENIAYIKRNFDRYIEAYELVCSKFKEML
ncbi:MAG: response regulator [Lachnospiraceae bacterium]|nr:response regulator [Lachnospiraceae bacterium]